MDSRTELMDDHGVDEEQFARAFARPMEGQLPVAQPIGGAVAGFEHSPVGAQAVAVQRDEARVLQKVKAVAAAAGTDWFYRFPVKKKGGGVDHIEGPSIKLANNVARLYGNCQIDTRVVDAGATWIIYARFVDIETGFALTRPFQQAKGASRLGGTGPEADARRLDIALQIGVSKAIRNVVCNALETFTDFAFEEARKNLVGRIGQKIEDYRARAVAWFEKAGVDIKRVENSQGRAVKDWLATDLARIAAEIQAVTDGMATADETWPPLAPPAPSRGDFKDKPAAAATAQPEEPAKPTEATAAKTEPAAAEASDATAKTEPAKDAAEEPKPAETATVTKPWAIPDNIVGQEPRRKYLVEQLLPQAKVKADVDEIEETHKEFVEKLGRSKGETTRAIEARWRELPERLEEGDEQ